MVKAKLLGLIETCMKGNTKMGKDMLNGTYTWSDGRKWVGERRDGKLWQFRKYNKTGKNIGTYEMLVKSTK